MKVLLINPTERRLLQANLPKEIESLRGKNQPIGLMYVAAALRESPHIETRLLDAHALDLDASGIRSRVEEFSPEFIGLTCVSFNLPDVMDCVAAAKKGAPEAKIILGGLQPFLYPEETFHLPGVDGIIIGEAERSFPAYLKNPYDAVALEKIPGLKVRAGGQVIDTGPAPPIDELDALCPPAFDLLDPKHYFSVITDARPTINLITSRGCPFGCRFCSRSVTGKSYRFHSPERIMREVRQCLALGYKSILFYDEVFTLRRRRVIDLCAMIREEGPRFEWMARGTVNTVDEELLAAMKGAGCFLITIGVESGSERVLKGMKRPVTDPAATIRVFEDAGKVGINTLAYLMVGNPGEMEEDLAETSALLKRIDPDHVHVSVFVSYPATDFYEEGLADGLFPKDVWREFSANPTRKFFVPTWPEALPADELFRQARTLTRRFYFRPKKVWQEIRNAKNWRGIKKRLPYIRALMKAPKRQSY